MYLFANGFPQLLFPLSIPLAFSSALSFNSFKLKQGSMMEVASMELVRQFNSRRIVVTAGHRQNKILCRFCNKAEWTQFPKDLPELEKRDAAPLKASSLAHCHSPSAKEHRFLTLLIHLLKCETVFSVVKALYCQRISFWRILLGN